MLIQYFNDSAVVPPLLALLPNAAVHTKIDDLPAWQVVQQVGALARHLLYRPIP